MSYINLFYIFIVLAIVMFVISIVMFFAMDIPNAIRIVNKKMPKKKGQKKQNKPATGELSQKQHKKVDVASVPQITGQREETTVLPANNSPKEKKKTTVLPQNQAVTGEQPQPVQPPKKQTTVLQHTGNYQINKKTGDMNAITTNNDVFEIVETTAFISSEKTI